MAKRKHAEWDERGGPAANAQRVLPAQVAAYFAEVRSRLAADPGPEELHKVRLATKHLRYTLELFRPCYGPGLEMRVAVLREIQTALGELNDRAVAARVISETVRSRAQRDRALRTLEGERAERTREFHKLWSEVIDAPGQETWWTSYLGRNARAPGRK